MSKASGTVLITGASAGIGRELARVFAENGYDLIAVARGSDELEALAREIRDQYGRSTAVLPADLLTPGAPEVLHKNVQAQHGPVDVLVNNAGVMELGAFSETDPAELERMVELNARVLTSLTRFFVASMRDRGHGRILNVASTAAFQPVPSLAVYAATKAYVLSLTETLSVELSNTGVTVTALCPGLTHTALTDKAKRQNEWVALWPDSLMADPHDVARAGFAACMAGEVIHVPGLANRALTDWLRIQPRWIARTLGGLVFRRFLEKR